MELLFSPNPHPSLCSSSFGLITWCLNSQCDISHHMFSRKYHLFCTLPKVLGGFGWKSAPGGGRLLRKLCCCPCLSPLHMSSATAPGPWLSLGTVMSLCWPWDGSLNKCLPLLLPTKPNFLHIQIFKHLEGEKNLIKEDFAHLLYVAFFPRIHALLITIIFCHSGGLKY